MHVCVEIPFGQVTHRFVVSDEYIYAFHYCPVLDYHLVRLRNVKQVLKTLSQNSMRMRWTPEEVDSHLKRIMTDIHETCVKYGKEEDGYVNYVKGANIAGFIKVAEAMMAQGLV